MVKPFIKKFRVPVYRNSVWVVIHPSIVQAIDHIEDLIDVPLHMENKAYRAFFYSYFNHEDRARAIIFLRPYTKVGEVVHEVNHCLNFIFQVNGVKLSTANDEHQSYYLEYLVNKVLDIQKQSRRKKRKPNETPKAPLSDITFTTNHPDSSLARLYKGPSPEVKTCGCGDNCKCSSENGLSDYQSERLDYIQEPLQ